MRSAMHRLIFYTCSRPDSQMLAPVKLIKKKDTRKKERGKNDSESGKYSNP